jgi:Alw26I/Eco31I/Esp3I family type II restriction m6 adenine DNA methyltransferase
MAKKLDIEKTRIALQNFEFGELFREELGWSSPKSTQAKTESVKEITFSRKPVAELSGAVVFEITLSDGALPDSNQRKDISKYIRDLHYENVCIFVDKDRSQSIWHWEKKQDKKMMPRDHFYMRGQPGDLFIGKLSSLVVDLSDFDKEGNIPIAEVASRMKAALDVEVVTKKFYKSYQDEFNGFLEFIEGITDENDKKWYASVILNRLMFIYFLQRKFFLDDGNADYLASKLEYSKKHLGKNKYYEVFLKKLFFEGFAKEEKHRTAETNKLIGKIKYLNGGLFLQHKIEKKYHGKIKISDVAFENLLKLFKDYSWNLNDTPGGQDNELNPDVLGYIFEKYINQKAFGAYYTRTEITEYLCEQTVYKLILDAINGPDTSAFDETIEKVKGSSSLLSKPTLLSSRNKTEGKRKHYERIEDLLIDLDADTCRKLVVNENAVLPNLSLLDPACGSGAFLVAAMKTLINVYAAILGKIKFLGDKKLKAWLDEIEANHPSVNYYIKKQIITNNLYGVDIMEEASEIAKLRLFLALVASAQKVDDLEPLPNIDFNIMCGNSLIGLMRVDEKVYNQHQKGDMFKKSYNQLIQEREAAIRAFKSFEGDREVLQSKKEAIDRLEGEANDTLNVILGQEFHNLGIKYEQQSWDEKKKKIGKPLKRSITKKDIEALTPFHWGYEFSEIFRKKDGFDAIITNPPWEIFKPQAKEFFGAYSNLVTKKKMSIKDFEKEQGKLLIESDIREAWLEYESSFPHISQYYRSASLYKNQISIVGGKKAGTDINLYKLFTEQCFNLLRKDGYCGIVIPSGIYTDLGAKQLRQMLFEEARITGLFCFENRKEIFEGVHRSFKFVVLSFEKGGCTISFPAAFMRHEVSELDSFPQSGAMVINIDFIKKQSPESLSVPEVKNDTEYQIALKLSELLPIGEKVSDCWNIKLTNEFHMTNDSHLFQNKPSNSRLPLFEGKMINQFDSHYAEPKYWIEEKVGRKALLGKVKDEGQLLDYQTYRVAFREIAASTNERGLIATVLPKNIFANHKLMISHHDSINLTNKNKLLVVGILNSFVFDYQIRMRMSTSISMHVFYQSYAPRINSTSEVGAQICKRALELVCVSNEFSELWSEVMNTKWSKDKVAIKEDERAQLRAELDGYVAHIYGLNEDEFQYVLSTFPIVDEKVKQDALQAYRDLAPRFRIASPPFPSAPGVVHSKPSPELILKVLIQKGEHKQLEFKSTMLWDVREQTKKYHVEHSVLKTIAAFLNSEGGTLLIGVTDDGQIHGLEDDFKVLGSKGDPRDNFNKAFDNLISNNFGRDIHRLVSLTLEPIDGKLVAKVVVKEKAPEEVFLANKDKNSIEEFYVRLNASSVALTGREQSKYIKGHWK